MREYQSAFMGDHVVEVLKSKSVLVNSVSTLTLILLFFILRYFAYRAIIRAPHLSSETRRKWIVNVRTGLLFFLIGGIVVVWASEIREVAISLVALAVAVVLATKELILCLTGSFLRTLGRSFSIGDRIEIKGVRGDVIDQSLLTTTILEIGPGHSVHQQTGRAITIPNKVFLEENVVNESYTDDYVLHVLSIPLKRHENWKLAEDILLDAAKTECAPFMDSARRHFNRMTAQLSVEMPSLDPRVILSFPDEKTTSIILRVCVPARQKGRIEQAIIRKFLAAFPHDRGGEKDFEGDE